MNAFALTAIVVGALVALGAVAIFVDFIRRKFFPPAATWEHGTCEGRRARRHRDTGAVQFVLWRAGERGHVEDYWHNFHPTWWAHFEADSQ